VTDSIGVNAQFSGDGADFPMLGVKVAADLHTGFWIDHLGRSSARRNPWEGIDETAAAATDGAAQPVTSADFRPSSHYRYCLRHPTTVWCRRNDRKGTLIRHAGLARPPGTAPPVFPLAVAVVEPSLRAALVAAVGAAPLLESGLGAASRTAIALPAITVLTDPEHRLAFAAAANPLTENRFAMDRHPRRQAGLDNGSQSWQVRTIESGDLPKVASRDSAAYDGGVPQPFPPSRKRQYPIGEPAG
jgi:hypothetical protein